jgi:hypothetical protein
MLEFASSVEVNGVKCQYDEVVGKASQCCCSLSNLRCARLEHALIMIAVFTVKRDRPVRTVSR